jgi:hypothetical protein
MKRHKEKFLVETQSVEAINDMNVLILMQKISINQGVKLDQRSV